MPGKTNLEAILERAAKFVVRSKGQWDHQDWEDYLGSVSNLGLTMDDETKRHLGNVLESSKHLYENGGSGMAPAARSAKPKAKAKPKPKAKPGAAKK